MAIRTLFRARFGNEELKWIETKHEDPTLIPWKRACMTTERFRVSVSAQRSGGPPAGRGSVRHSQLPRVSHLGMPYACRYAASLRRVEAALAQPSPGLPSGRLAYGGLVDYAETAPKGAPHLEGRLDVVRSLVQQTVRGHDSSLLIYGPARREVFLGSADCEGFATLPHHHSVSPPPPSPTPAHPAVAPALVVRCGLVGFRDACTVRGAAIDLLKEYLLYRRRGRRQPPPSEEGPLACPQATTPAGGAEGESTVALDETSGPVGLSVLLARADREAALHLSSVSTGPGSPCGSALGSPLSTGLGMGADAPLSPADLDPLRRKPALPVFGKRPSASLLARAMRVKMKPDIRTRPSVAPPRRMATPPPRTTVEDAVEAELTSPADVAALAAICRVYTAEGAAPHGRPTSAGLRSPGGLSVGIGPDFVLPCRHVVLRLSLVPAARSPARPTTPQSLHHGVPQQQLLQQPRSPARPELPPHATASVCFYTACPLEYTPSTSADPLSLFVADAARGCPFAAEDRVLRVGPLDGLLARSYKGLEVLTAREPHTAYLLYSLKDELVALLGNGLLDPLSRVHLWAALTPDGLEPEETLAALAFAEKAQQWQKAGGRPSSDSTCSRLARLPAIPFLRGLSFLMRVGRTLCEPLPVAAAPADDAAEPPSREARGDGEPTHEYRGPDQEDAFEKEDPRIAPPLFRSLLARPPSARPGAAAVPSPSKPGTPALAVRPPSAHIRRRSEGHWSVDPERCGGGAAPEGVAEEEQLWFGTAARPPGAAGAGAAEGPVNWGQLWWAESDKAAQRHSLRPSGGSPTSSPSPGWSPSPRLGPSALPEPDAPASTAAGPGRPGSPAGSPTRRLRRPLTGLPLTARHYRRPSTLDPTPYQTPVTAGPPGSGSPRHTREGADVVGAVLAAEAQRSPGGRPVTARGRYPPPQLPAEMPVLHALSARPRSAATASPVGPPLTPTTPTTAWMEEDVMRGGEDGILYSALMPAEGAAAAHPPISPRGSAEGGVVPVPRAAMPPARHQRSLSEAPRPAAASSLDEAAAWQQPAPHAAWGEGPISAPADGGAVLTGRHLRSATSRGGPSGAGPVVIAPATERIKALRVHLAVQAIEEGVWRPVTLAQSVGQGTQGGVLEAHQLGPARDPAPYPCPCPCHPATLPPCHPATLPPCHPATLPPGRAAATPLAEAAVTAAVHSSRPATACLPPLSSPGMPTMTGSPLGGDRDRPGPVVSLTHPILYAEPVPAAMALNPLLQPYPRKLRGIRTVTPGGANNKPRPTSPAARAATSPQQQQQQQPQQPPQLQQPPADTSGLQLRAELGPPDPTLIKQQHPLLSDNQAAQRSLFEMFNPEAAADEPIASAAPPPRSLPALRPTSALASTRAGSGGGGGGGLPTARARLGSALAAARAAKAPVPAFASATAFAPSGAKPAGGRVIISAGPSTSGRPSSRGAATAASTTTAIAATAPAPKPATAQPQPASVPHTTRRDGLLGAPIGASTPRMLSPGEAAIAQGPSPSPVPTEPTIDLADEPPGPTPRHPYASPSPRRPVGIPASPPIELQQQQQMLLQRMGSAVTISTISDLESTVTLTPRAPPVASPGGGRRPTSMLDAPPPPPSTPPPSIPPPSPARQPPPTPSPAGPPSTTGAPSTLPATVLAQTAAPPATTPPSPSPLPPPGPPPRSPPPGEDVELSLTRVLEEVSLSEAESLRGPRPPRPPSQRRCRLARTRRSLRGLAGTGAHFLAAPSPCRP
ncbi:hypothetical protein PAPYR_2763 [Paratrimastix pyriformis]|uniref:Uncharacterized protein n=1 Tax=Paratrimastix pyriformis TaxID=342808 RepID=A0ABQ8UP10_9EUKA|nr:hypothetical protein PAPYR_2763 [Paratrimastix pyriformis]